MATDLQNLQTRRSAVIAELAALAAGRAGGQPTYNIDGEMVDHVSYKKSLYEELTNLNTLIEMFNGPAEYISEVTT